MTAAKRPPAPRHLRRTDLRGLVRLAAQATEGVAHITEGVHQSVWRTLGFPGRSAQRAGGLTGLVYRSIGGITRGVGWGLDRALAGAEPLLGPDAGRPDSARRVAWLSALNGVMGDRLAADRNPLAIDMSLRGPHGGAVDPDHPVTVDAPRRRILLMVHGLCMNDLQWRTTDERGRPHDHGQAVADAQGSHPLYLRYNTGRSIRQNGDELATLLDRLTTAWPVPLDELSVLAHSMGGLVMRSAIHQGLQRGLAWPARLKHVVFLGTPHHGAPLEQAGHLVDRLLARSRWSAPFVGLTGLRSAGITDLRHGQIDAAPTGSGTASGRDADASGTLPLPPGIRFHAVAATTAARRSPLADRLFGDGLVPLDSALGRHRDPRRRLDIAPGSRWIVYRTGHLALLSRPAIADRIVRWMA